MSLSYWHRLSAPNVEVDVAIVGGGICGVSAALHAARRGLRVILLERGSVASAASGRNAGFLMRGLAENYSRACAAFTRARARFIWKLSEQNLDGLRSEGANSLASYVSQPSCLLALTPAERNSLDSSFRLLRDDGFDARWIESGTDTLWSRGRALAGLLNPHDAAVNPVDLVRLLASKLPPGTIQQGTEAIRITPDGDRVLIHTPVAAVVASHALVCVNAYLRNLYPDRAAIVSPNRGQMLAARVENLRLDACYYANFGSEYFRQTHDGALIVGGCRTRHQLDEAVASDQPSETVQQDIEAFALQTLGLRLDVIHRWAGVMGFSADGLPVISMLDQRVWFCGGFTGHGMSLAYATSHAALGVMLDGSPNPFPDAASHRAADQSLE